jgi:ammonium transporter, Amt family
VNNLGALAIGLLAGLIVVGAVLFFDRIHIDDPVGAVSVHGVCGLFGVLAVGLFATTEGSPLGADSVEGLFYGGGTGQLVSQLIGVVAIAGFVAVAMGVIFGGIKLIMGLRVSEQEEVEGLDVHEHGSAGYGEDIGFSSTTSTSMRAGADMPARV